jgi:hypothetical protein
MKEWRSPIMVKIYPPPTAEEVRSLRRAIVTADVAKELGHARRVYEAELRSGWDDYAGALAAARAGYVSRLADLLRARRKLYATDYHHLIDYILTKLRRRCWPEWLVEAVSKLPTEQTYDRLADLVEALGRRQGRMFDAPVHRAARLAEVMLTVVPGKVPDELRDSMIVYACEIEGDEADVAIDPEQVRELLRRPRARRHKH